MVLRLFLALTLVLTTAVAQQKTVSSSTRPGVNDNADGALEGTRPDSVLKVVKARGTIQSINLQKRTILYSLQKIGPLELAFSQPLGREQIKTSKKSFKRTGKNRLRLEELKAGDKVHLQYYPVLAQVLEIQLD